MSPEIPEHLFIPNDTDGKIMILSLMLFIANLSETANLPLAETILRNAMQSH